MNYVIAASVLLCAVGSARASDDRQERTGEGHDDPPSQEPGPHFFDPPPRTHLTLCTNATRQTDPGTSLAHLRWSVQHCSLDTLESTRIYELSLGFLSRKASIHDVSWMRPLLKTRPSGGRGMHGSSLCGLVAGLLARQGTAHDATDILDELFRVRRQTTFDAGGCIINELIHQRVFLNEAWNIRDHLGDFAEGWFLTLYSAYGVLPTPESTIPPPYLTRGWLLQGMAISGIARYPLAPPSGAPCEGDSRWHNTPRQSTERSQGA